MTVQLADTQTSLSDRRMSFFQAGAILLFALLSGAICIWYVSLERCVYVWDFSGYWNMATLLAQTFRQSPADAADAIFHSIAHDEYNMLPVVPVSLAMLVVGDSRAAYVSCVAAIYGPAVLAAIIWLCRSLARRIGVDGPAAILIPSAVLSCCPLYWSPILRGCPDVIGLLPLLLALRLYFSRPLLDHKLLAWVCIGLLLATAILLRRWYIYWVAGFFAVAAVDWIVCLVCSRGRQFKTGTKIAIAMGTMAICTALPICLLAWPMVRRIASSDYGAMYAAYKYHATLWDAMIRLIQYAGLFHIFMMAVAVAVLLATRETRRAVIFLVCQFVVMGVLFYRMQGMGIHHYYLFAPIYLITVGLALCLIAGRLRNMAARLAIPAVYFAGMLACCAVVFLPTIAWAGNRVFPSDSCYPMRRGDVESLAALTARMDELVGGDKGKSVYVLASSYTLCEETLKNAPRSLAVAFRSAENVERTSHVDLRDGIPPGLLNARIIVVAQPIQYHLAEQYQRVISLPAAGLLEGKNIGRAFRRLPEEFQLDTAVKVILFERTRPSTQAEADELLDVFKRTYPDRVNLFDVRLK